MILRVINKHTKIYIRDDITYDEATEIGLSVDPPSSSLYKPLWREEWIEGATQEEIDEMTEVATQPPSVSERLNDLENTILMLLMQ